MFKHTFIYIYIYKHTQAYVSGKNDISVYLNFADASTIRSFRLATQVATLQFRVEQHSKKAIELHVTKHVAIQPSQPDARRERVGWKNERQILGIGKI